MATKESNYVINLDVNTSKLTKALDKIRDLNTTDLKKISPQIDDKQLNAELNKIRATVNTLENAFTKAFNPKLNTVNIKTFKNELAGSNTNLQQVYNTLKQTGEVGENAFRQLSTKMLDTNIKLKETSGLFKEMGTTLKNSIKWNIASSVINTFSGKIQEAYGYVKSLDSSLNDIRIVTGKSADEMDRFAEKANKAAKELGKSTTDYTKASLIYYQQGLSDEESAARTDVTLKAANVTQQSAQEVSEQLTAVWNGYKVSAQEAELYVDKLAAVAAGTASDLEELSTGMSKVASAANALGVDVDQMNAILSTSISVTRQAPETIGSAYKTIFARMSTISAGGTDEEDGATLTSYTDKMNKLGINVLDANNQLRDMGDVIEEVGGKWGSFSKEQQIALAQVMAGTRQYNNLIALFDNWDKYTAALNMSANAAGTLNEQQDIYMQSTQAHLQQLSTATEGVFDSLLGGEDINKVIDAIIPIVEGIESVIDAIGGGAGVLQLFGPMLLRSFSPEIAQQILTIHHNLQAVASNKQALENLHETINTFTNIKGVEGATQELMEYERQLGEFANFMSPEEFEEQRKKIKELSNSYEQYGQARIKADTKLIELRKALSDKSITKDNYQDKVKEAGDAQDKLSKISKQITDSSKAGGKASELIKVSKSIKGNGPKKELQKASEDLQVEIEKINEKITEQLGDVSQNPAFKKVSDKFEEITSQLKKDSTPQQVREIYEQVCAELQEAVDNEITTIDKATSTIKGELDEAIQAEQNAKNVSEELSQSVQDGFSDERLKAFTEGTVELTTSLFQVGSAAVNLATNLHDIWNNDDLTNAEKFAQTLQLIAMNAGVMGNGLSSAKKAIDKLGSTYRASVKDQAANAIASTAQAKANQKVADTAEEAGKAVKKAGEEDIKEAATSKIAEEANEGQSNAYKNQTNAPGLGTNIKDAAKGSLKAAKTGITKIGEVIAGSSSIGAGIASLSALIAALAAVAVAVKLSYDAFTETERALERSQEAYDNSKKSLSELTSEFNNLNSAIDQIDQERATLNELVTGTTEWKEQLDKVNESVASLLEQFPELKQYATFKDGGWEVENSKLEEFQQRLKEQQADAQNMVYANEIDLAAAKRDKAAHKAQNDATDFGSTVGATAAAGAAGTAFVGSIIGLIAGGPIGAAIGTAIGGAIGGAVGAVAGVVEGTKDKKEAAVNIEYDKNRGSAQETQALLEKYQNATDETIKAELKQEIANTFSGLNENSSDNRIEEYLSNLVELQKAQNELDKIQIENSKAMLDANFGDQITEALTDKGYDERQQQIIKNAVERRAAEAAVSRGQTIRSNLLNDNGEIKDEKMKAEFQAFIQKSWAEQMGIKASDVVMTGEGGNSFHLKSKMDSSIKSDTLDYQDFLEEFIAYSTTQGDIANKSIEKWISTFESSDNSAYIEALADEIAAGNVDISTLTQSELEALKDIAESGIGGINISSLKEALNESNENQKAIRESITSTSGRETYDYITTEMTGAENLTEEQMRTLAEKINAIYSEYGTEGVKKFKESLEGENVSVALDFDKRSIETGLSDSIIKQLDEAKIDLDTFDTYKRALESKGAGYSDQDIVNMLKSQEKLNKIYKDRKEIFSSLRKADPNNLDAQQIEKIKQLKEALSERLGFDISEKDILKNLDAIEGYFSKTTEGTKKFQEAMSKLKAESLNLNTVFQKYFDDKGNAPLAGFQSDTLEQDVAKIAEQLQLTNEEVIAIYAQYGYVQDKNGHFVRNDDVNLYYKFGALEAKYDVGSTQNIATLLEEYGFDDPKELEEYGWEKAPGEAGKHGYYRKISAAENIAKITTLYHVNDAGETFQRVSDVADKPAAAWEAEGYVWFEIPEKGWYRKINVWEEIAKQISETTSTATQVNADGENDFTGEDETKQSTKTTTKKDITHEYDVNYDVQDNLIKVKEKELKRLQEFEENLTGEGLKQNLEQQKELYEEILELQEQKNEMALKDVETQKDNLDNLLKEKGLTGAQYDEETGYVTNIGDILREAETAKNNAAIEYNKKVDEGLTGEDLTPYTEAYDAAADTLKELKSVYDNYISALGAVDDVTDEIIESQKNLDENRISSYLTDTQNQLEKLSGIANDFASAMSDVNAEFNKLYGDEQSEALDEWMDYATLLSQVLEKQQDTFKLGLDNLSSMATDKDSGLSNTDKQWVKDEIDAIKATDDSLFDQGRYIVLLAEIENKIAEAQKKLQDLINSGASQKDIEAAQSELSSWEALGSGIKAAQSQAKELAKTLDDVYLTAGEVEEKFSEWQISAIDTQIGLIDKKISRLQKQAGKLKGQALIDNLKQQNQQIEKQIKLEKSKLKLLQAQMQIKKMMLQQSLSELAASLGVELSLQFDSLGNITTESITKMSEIVMASLKAAGATGAAAQQQWNALLQMMDAYNAAAAAVQASMDAIEGYGDSMKDNLDAMKDALKEARDKALEIFNAKVDVEINIEDAWRQLDKLQAKVNGIKDTDFFEQAKLSFKSIERYIGVISNPNSYFGSGKGSIGILTDHVNDIMSEIGIMQSGGTSQYYGKDEGAAFDDLMNYANQLMSQVEAFYQELENVRQQYSAVIDAIISKNQELLDDYDKMNQLSKHGINITKLLYGENSYQEMQSYYDNISKNTKAMLKQATEAKAYYEKEMKRLAAKGQTDSEAYQKMREGYEESMQQVYEYGEQLLEQYSEELMNKVNSYNQKMTDTLANLAGFADELLMDQDWEYQTKLMDDYLDATNAAYEMQALQSKFQTSIDDTDNLSSKRELTKVMNEQLGILEKQLEDGQLLTQYDIDRANKVYELTLKQIALEEAQQNKSKMRLRRDSQGNYRYEYVADQEKIEDARQDLLKTQNDLYNLDKNRTVEMINEVKNLRAEYLQNEQAILEDAYLTKEEKEQALVDLQNKYYAQPDGLIYMAVQEYNEAKKNMESDTDEEISFYHNTMAEAMSQNWEDIAATEQLTTERILTDLELQAEKVAEATDLMSQGYGSLQGAIEGDINAMEELLLLDEQLLNKYEEEMIAIEDLMAELEALEGYYQSVMEAALAAVEAALQLRQMKWDDDDDDDGGSSSSSGSSGSDSSGGGSGSSITSRTAAITIEEETGKGNSSDLSGYTGKEKKTIKENASHRGINSWGKLDPKKTWGTRYIPYDTGGYTGSWGKEGKIAMLHEKELVLNKTDTKNMLDTVNIVRQLGSSLSTIKDTFGAKLTKYSDTMNNNVNSMVIDKTSTQKLDQNVKIEANFPNVKNANEIETAFNNLVNLASQRTMSTRR